MTIKHNILLSSNGSNLSQARIASKSMINDFNIEKESVNGDRSSEQYAILQNISML